MVESRIPEPRTVKRPDPPAFETTTLAEGDADTCLALSTAAGWNQTAGDWRFHLQFGEGIGLRTRAGRLIATGILLPAADSVGWIAMVLVDEDFRRRGLGRHVMTNLMNRRDFAGQALDATEQGLPLYEALGFRTLERIVRHRLRREGQPIFPQYLEGKHARTDLPFRGIPRKLAGRTDVSTVSQDDAIALVRPGRTALHVGPLAAASERAAAALIRSVLDQTKGDVLLDIPTRSGSFTRRMELVGFDADRVFVRMAHRTSFFVEPGIFAIAGPEYG